MPHEIPPFRITPHDVRAAAAQARNFAGRLRRAVRDELEMVDAPKALAEAMSSALPALTFARTRTALMRAAGFKLGPRTLVHGSIRVTGRGNHRDLMSVG